MDNGNLQEQKTKIQSEIDALLQQYSSLLEKMEPPDVWEKYMSLVDQKQIILENILKNLR